MDCQGCVGVVLVAWVVSVVWFVRVSWLYGLSRLKGLCGFSGLSELCYTRDTVSSGYLNTKKTFHKYDTQWSIFSEIHDVRIADEILSRLFGVFF